MNAIEIRNLSKSYKAFKLDRISLTLPEGTIMGLVGENGAGKSTTIKLILGIIKKDGGSITLLGKDNEDSIELTKEDIGVVLDEVGIHTSLTPRQVERIMKSTYKNWDSDAYKSYLQKFSIPTNKTFKEFSRGTKMKLGIAIALSHNPRLLILDEATSGLDPVVREEILDIFNEFTRDEKHSILISSHIVSDLEKICDYIAFISQGKLMLCEEKDALYEKYGIVSCSHEDVAGIPQTAVMSKKENKYNVELLVRREYVPAGIEILPCNIEQLFIFMTKEARDT